MSRGLRALLRHEAQAPDAAITVIVARRRDAWAARPLARSHPGLTVLRAAPVDDLHLQLLLGPRLDLVTDLSGEERAIHRLAMLVAHLRPGGRVVQRLPDTEPARADLLRLVDEARRLRESGDLKAPTSMDRRPERIRDVHALAATLGDLRADDDHVTGTVSVDLIATMSEQLADRFCERAPDRGQVLAHHEATEWQAPSPVVTSSRTAETTTRRTVAPALSLRVFGHPEVRPRMLATLDDVVLPQTFRHPTKRRPRSPSIVRWHDWYALRPEAAATTPLAGTYLHADSFLRGHFGHALAEQISHLWGWAEALRRFPDLRLLVSSTDESGPAEWEYLLWESAGIGRDLVTVIREPRVVERLVTTTAGYEIGEYVHPAVTELYDAMGAHLEALAETLPDPGPRPDRVFLTRRHDQRPCHNRDEVEAAAVEAGFTVLAPEEHPLPVQVAIARRASVIAGFGGSGLFHPVLAPGGKRMVVVTSQNYPAANEKQICAFRDNELSIVRGTPDVPDVEGFSLKAFHSAYTIDWTREGALLRQELARE